MDEIEILFTPDQIAKAAGFTAEKVRGLCSTGRLKSVNVSTGPGIASKKNGGKII